MPLNDRLRQVVLGNLVTVQQRRDDDDRLGASLTEPLRSETAPPLREGTPLFNFEMRTKYESSVEPHAAIDGADI
jgi:hypothetical protein